MRDEYTARGSGGSFYSSISGLATTLALFAAILATPPLFNVTADPLHAYLTRNWGEDLASLLVPACGVLEACTIFFSSRALFSMAAVWITLALLSRGFALA